MEHIQVDLHKQPKIKKTVIITGYDCNNNCIFCINSGKKGLFSKSTRQIIYEMADARRRGRDYLEIIGGENTIRNDLLRLIEVAKEFGFKDIVMATNGRMLAYRDYAAKLINVGITSIIFSIHGHNAILHDYLTRVKGSFKQLMEGIENIRGLNFENIGSNTTIVKQNYKYLPQIGDLIYNLGIKNAEFIFIDPKFYGINGKFKEIVPKVSKASEYIKRCLDIANYPNSGIKHWHIRYVPLCHFLKYQDRISELYEVRNFHTEHIGLDFINYNVEESRRQIGRVKPKRCNKCIYFDACEGIWKEYIEQYGDKELSPILH